MTCLIFSQRTRYTQLCFNFSMAVSRLSLIPIRPASLLSLIAKLDGVSTLQLPLMGRGRTGCTRQFNDQPQLRARKHFRTPAIWSHLGHAAKAVSLQPLQRMPVSPQPCSLKAPHLQREQRPNPLAGSAMGLEEGLALRRQYVLLPSRSLLIWPLTLEGTLGCRV